MRTAAQRNQRKTIYRVLSVIFVLIGVTHLAVLGMGSVYDDAFLRLADMASMWLLFGATWVALSRLWGELAEMSATSKN